jgi:hypothetical protein
MALLAVSGAGGGRKQGGTIRGDMEVIILTDGGDGK